MIQTDLFGTVHIIASLTAAASASAAAAFVTGRLKTAEKSCRTGTSGDSGQSVTAKDNKRKTVRVLAVCGWLLAALEICKQFCLLQSGEGGAYDWWYFPFQLCSVPMYLCILLPLVRARVRRAFLSFMSGYTFISAVAALLYPEDFMNAGGMLAVHGFLWHGMLLFISLLIMMDRAMDTEAGSAEKSAAVQRNRLFPDIIDAAALFAVLSMVAVLINMAAEPAMQAAYAKHLIPHSYAAMFYMNPYHISPQPLVSDVQNALGIPAGLLLYALAIMAAGSAVLLADQIKTIRK